MQIKRLLFLLLFTPCLLAQQTLEQATELCKQKKFALARPLLENLLKTDPKNVEIISRLGEIAFYTKDWDPMVHYGEELTKLEPQKADSWYKYGGALAMKAKHSNPLKALTMVGHVEDVFFKALALDPKHIGARWALIMMYCELPKLFGGGQQKASRYAKELVSISAVDGYLAQGYIAVQFDAYKNAEFWLKKAYQLGHSKVTFEKLYDFYQYQLKDKTKAEQLKNDFK